MRPDVGVRLDQRLRPVRARPRARGLRPDGAGRERLAVAERRSRRRAGEGADLPRRRPRAACTARSPRWRRCATATARARASTSTWRCSTRCSSSRTATPRSAALGVPLPRMGNEFVVAAPASVYACTRRLRHARRAARRALEDPRAADGPARARGADPDYATTPKRVARRAELNALVADWVAPHGPSRRRRAARRRGPARLARAHLRRGRARSARARARHAADRRRTRTAREAPIIGPAAKLSRTPVRVRSAAPALGAHADEILAELGIDGRPRAAARRRRRVSVENPPRSKPNGRLSDRLRQGQGPEEARGVRDRRPADAPRRRRHRRVARQGRRNPRRPARPDTRFIATFSSVEPRAAGTLARVPGASSGRRAGEPPTFVLARTSTDSRMRLCCRDALVALGTPAPAGRAPATGVVRGKVTVLKKKLFGGLGRSGRRERRGRVRHGLQRGAAEARVAVLEQENERFQPRILPIVAGQSGERSRTATASITTCSRSRRSSRSTSASTSRAIRRARRCFAKPGLVPVYCNIHPQMISYVVVLENAAFAVTGEDGALRAARRARGRDRAERVDARRAARDAGASTLAPGAELDGGPRARADADARRRTRARTARRTRRRRATTTVMRRAAAPALPHQDLARAVRARLRGARGGARRRAGRDARARARARTRARASTARSSPSRELAAPARGAARGGDRRRSTRTNPQLRTILSTASLAQTDLGVGRGAARTTRSATRTCACSRRCPRSRCTSAR